MSLKRGSLIKVRAFGGKEIVRRFLTERNEVFEPSDPKLKEVLFYSVEHIMGFFKT
jgi:hypothetical protein